MLDLQRTRVNPSAHLTDWATAQSRFNDLRDLFGRSKPTDDPDAD